MSSRTNRRTFLKSTAAVPLAAALCKPRAAFAAPAAQIPPPPPGAVKKSVLYSMLPKDLPVVDKFKVAIDAGFVGVEMHTEPDPAQAEQAKAAAEKTGLKIHSVMNADHWKFPLSSPDPGVVLKSVAGMETSLKNAALWGATNVLLVPAVVDGVTAYGDAWARSQKVIKSRILPLAADLKIVVAIEEVWNKFLLSPLEMARYVDELDSPWARAYFDVGNVVLYGYPQDWIRTLGPRIVRVHLKDFKMDRRAGRFEWKNIGEGDIDWIEVRRAFAEINYSGYMTTEIEGGDAAYLKDVNARLDRFLSGQKPV